MQMYQFISIRARVAVFVGMGRVGCLIALYSTYIIKCFSGPARQCIRLFLCARDPRHMDISQRFDTHTFVTCVCVSVGAI